MQLPTKTVMQLFEVGNLEQLGIRSGYLLDISDS